MNLTNIALGLLLIMTFLNTGTIYRIGRDMQAIKCEVECTKKNMWYTQDLLLREKK